MFNNLIFSLKKGNACQMSHECCSVCYKGMCASLILPAAGMPFQQDTVPEENFLSLSSASSNARKSKSKARARARNKVKKARAFSRSMFYGDYGDDNCLGYGENCNHHHQCCDGYCHFGHSFDYCA
jgi:hypothetical protein